MIDKQELTPVELIQYIKELIQWNALEFCEDDETQILNIPYLMNDAVECYVQLFDYVIKGSLDTKELDQTSVWQVENGGMHGIVLRHPSDQTLTLWYKKAVKTTGCYQYHQIGHNWRKEPGEEYVRRLVNLICVIHDKVSYLEPRYVQKLEKKIASLAEFPPVLYYTPINESILAWYPETEDGICTAIEIAEIIGNQSLRYRLNDYKAMFAQGLVNESLIHDLANHLALSECMAFWEQLYLWLETASRSCEVRQYLAEEEKQIERFRSKTIERYRTMGYEGVYPLLKKRVDSETEYVYFAEEHPFTTMEWDDYVFHIYSIHYKDKNMMHCHMERE